MKLTKNKLKQLIKEELEKVLQENQCDHNNDNACMGAGCVWEEGLGPGGGTCSPVPG